MKRSGRACAYLAGGLLLGVALAPVGAQPLAPADGQVAVRSDGAVYLIANGQRRWIATVAITDEEINAYPEAEPIYAGVVPLGAPTVTAPQVASSPQAVSSPTMAPVVGATPGAGTTAQADPQLPIEVDIDGPETLEPGESLSIDLKTKTGATCELAVKWTDGTEVDQAKQTADSRGRCHYTIDIPVTAPAGTGMLKGIARDGALMSRQDVEFEVIPKN